LPEAPLIERFFVEALIPGAAAGESSGINPALAARGPSCNDENGSEESRGRWEEVEEEDG